MRRASKALILLIAILGSSIVYAADGDSVNLTVGRSTVVDTGTSIARVSLTSADVADALVTSSNELLINGKMPGTISMFVWDRAGGIRKYEVNVQRDLGRLSEQLIQLFPGEKITANSSGKSIVLSGEASSQNVVDKAMSVSAGYVDKKDEVVSLLQVLPSTVGDHVQLHVRPEVSTLDFNNAILLQGFRIPALSTRRAETDVELQSGQTFAIAGLLNSTVSTSLQKIPGIGDIPILGNLFRSKAAQKDQTELVVMITPEILPRGSSGVTPNLPRVQEQFLQPIPEKKSMEMPPPAFRRQATGAAEQQAPAPNASPSKPASTSNPAAAAAAVSALTPNSVPVVNTETTAPA